VTGAPIHFHHLLCFLESQMPIGKNMMGCHGTVTGLFGALMLIKIFQNKEWHSFKSNLELLSIHLHFKHKNTEPHKQ
jgi:hypothetical protein